jgi:AcrR family transcriptional regulator
MSSEVTVARPPGRPPGPSAKGLSTRQHIIDAASQVFADLGYDKARMNDLVAATGMTKGAVYFHFDSKESLAVAVLEHKHQAWIAAVEQHLEAVPAGGSRLAALLPAMLALHQDDPTTWAISKLTRNLTELDATREHAAALTARWVALVADLVREAVREGDGVGRQDLDPVMAATVLVGAFDGLKAVHDTLADSGENFSTASELLNEMLLAYLTGGGKSSKSSNLRQPSQ